MQLDHSFNVPVSLDEAWKTLLDFERIAPCLPGATLQSIDNDILSGSVKIKLGPVMLNYKGTATIMEKDPSDYRMVLDGRAKDIKGNGTAAATISTVLVAEDESLTRVDITTDLNITGRPAQFGRGMLQEVGGRVIDQFAERLSEELTSPKPTEDGPELVSHDGHNAYSSQTQTDALDLGSVIDTSVVKKSAAAAAAFCVILWAVLRERNLRKNRERRQVGV